MGKRKGGLAGANLCNLDLVQGVKTIMLDDDWSACERGNILVVSDDRVLCYLHLSVGNWLEVSWCPANYPALNVSVVQMTDEALAASLNKECQGWEVRKMNLDGVNLDGE